MLILKQTRRSVDRKGPKCKAGQLQPTDFFFDKFEHEKSQHLKQMVLGETRYLHVEELKQILSFHPAKKVTHPKFINTFHIRHLKFKKKLLEQGVVRLLQDILIGRDFWHRAVVAQEIKPLSDNHRQSFNYKPLYRNGNC